VNAGAIDRALYFAYGSNLLFARLRERVASARVVGAACLEDHRLSFGKLGRDGSGKATLVAEVGSQVWGAVYDIHSTHWERLDAFEPGYARVAVEVTMPDRRRLSVATYLAPEATPPPMASADYVALVIAGAREHALPSAYIDDVVRLAERLALSE
jgi:gamma-glutamylcyclotransferase (GGCT)/AIG2-like uncharacterized protein YtfP